MVSSRWLFLFQADIFCKGATLGFEGVYFHMGTPFYYSMWQPVAYNNTPATVYPTYYSLLFLAELLSDISSPTILELSAYENNNLAAYAIYDGQELSKIAVLNLAFYSDTTVPRPAQTIDVTAVFKDDLQVRRLTGTLSTTTNIENATWVGQTYATGKATGGETIEKVENGLVNVSASEAIIIERR
jgi:hypothetical protein